MESLTVTPDQCVVEIMTHEVKCVSENTSLSEAARVLAEQGIRHLIVTDDSDRLAGVFSDRDLMKHTVHQMSHSLDPAGVPVKVVMAESPLTVSPLTTIKSASYLLAKNKFGCLPVVAEDNTVLGIVSVVDVLRYFSVEGKSKSTDETDRENGFHLDIVRLVNDFELAKVVYESHAANLTHLVEELEISKTQTEELLKSKTRFLSNISHEIRTPLTSILGYSELLSDTELDIDATSYVETITRNGRFLLDIVNDILDISRIDAQKMQIDKVATSPAHIVLDVVDSFRAKAEEKGISLIPKAYGPVPETIQTDPTRLKQILMNLVGNAVKFTDRGFVMLSLQFPASQVEPARILFEVKDTGVGISRNKIPDLFQPFTQVDNASARQYGGSGLGLAISQKLAEMLGGEITVESKIAEGSVFQFTVDVGDLETIQLRDVSFEEESCHSYDLPLTEENLTADGTPLKILIGDDDPDVLKLLEFLLQKVNVEITLANNGLQVYQLVEEAWHLHAPFDVILMDMEMPFLNGYQITSKLREIGYSGQIVAVTAHHDEQGRRKCIDAGCDAFLSKPLSADSLYSILATPVVCIL